MKICPDCGHDAAAAQSGVCGIIVNLDAGTVCGCTALGTNAICITCGKRFHCTRAGEPGHDPFHPCWSCWYAAEMTQADQDFFPLSAALARHGLPGGEVWQTGGMVMCYAVPLRGDGTLNPPYLLFGSDGDAGFSLYWTEEGGVSVSATLSALPVVVESPEDQGWTPEWSETVAKWVATVLPTVRAWSEPGSALREEHLDGRHQLFMLYEF